MGSFQVVGLVAEVLYSGLRDLQTSTLLYFYLWEEFEGHGVLGENTAT